MGEAGKLEYTFEMATEEDRDEILALYKSQVGRNGCPWTEEYPSNETIDFDLSRDALFVLRSGSGIIGAVSIDEDEEVNRLPFWDRSLEPESEFSRIAVRPELQGRGIGKILVRSIMEEMSRRGFRGVHILVNKHNKAALRLYDSFEFRNTGECHMYEQDFYCYEKDLSSGYVVADVFL